MHTIRLRGPWQLEPLARYVLRAGRWEPSTEGLPGGARLTMPADWSAAFGADFLGRVRYDRVFQSPTGLESGERVFLVVEPPRSQGTVSLSGRQLGEVRQGGLPLRFDITDQLQDHNRLEVVVEHPSLDDAEPPHDDNVTSSPGGLIGEVRLEIEE